MSKDSKMGKDSPPVLLPPTFQPPFAERMRHRKCIKRGIEFEAEVHAWFHTRARGAIPSALEIRIHPWMEWKGVLLQPDVVVVAEEDVWVLEIKLRHTALSAKQLTQYGEWLALIHPGKRVHLIEVYQYWDWSPYPAEVLKMEDGLELVDLDGHIGLWGFQPERGVVLELGRVWADQGGSGAENGA